MGAINIKGTIAAVVCVLSLGLSSDFIQARVDQKVAVDVPVETISSELGEWQGRESAGIDVSARNVLRLDRYLKRTYSREPNDVVLTYVGYWKRQTGDYQAAKHSPTLCLPSNGWSIEQRGEKTLRIPFGDSVNELKVRRLVGETRGKSFLFYYWFFGGESTYTKEWRALLTISLQKILKGRSDGGIVEISTPILGSGRPGEMYNQAEKRIEAFLSQLYPELHKLILESEQA